MRGALLLVLLGVAAFAQSADTFTYSYSGQPLPIIFSNSVATIVEIQVPKAVNITNVVARVQIDYPAVGDLNVFLFSPKSTRTKLLERNCGSLLNVNTTFDDSAPQMFNSVCPPAGVAPFRGNEPLGNSKGEPSIGTWRLAVQNNNNSSNFGWVTGFSVTITGTGSTTPQITNNTIVNSASYFGGSIAPGEMLTIFGSGLGPATPVSATSLPLQTTLGGTTVTINGQPAPIVYSSNYWVKVQVPFAVVAGSSVPVVVTYGGNNSPTANMDVVPAYPGVYTATGTATGQAEAFNADGTLNGTEHPAKAGSVISIYASGLGQLNPVIPAGAAPPANPLSLTSETVTAYIGGLVAPVWFSGAAPGYPGLYQINVQVPAAAPSGTRKLTISAAGLSSQQGVTIEVQ